MGSYHILSCLYILFGWTSYFTRGIEEDCFKCVCSATSACNLDIGCGDDDRCGPFRLNHKFWEESAIPEVEDGVEDWKDCVNDIECAKSAVHAYYDNFLKDCSGDDKVDCYDVLRMHELGRPYCQNTSRFEALPIYDRFVTCLKNTLMKVKVFD